MEWIVDVQGFKLPINYFVLKELEIVYSNNNSFSIIFKPPCAWKWIPTKYKRINNWLKNYFHGIYWCEDYIPYELVQLILATNLKMSRKIYVKGSEKRKRLKTLIDEKYTIIDLDDLDCPTIKTLIDKIPTGTCVTHSRREYYHCAYQNAIVSKNWLHKNC